MQRVFSTQSEASHDLVTTWARLSEREFFDGDLEVDPDGRLEFSFDKALAYPVSLTRLSTRCNLAYRRAWRHIRSNKIGSRVIWFVSKGTLRIARSQGSCEVAEGRAAIVDSSSPFHAKAVPGPDGQYESIQLTVPAHMFLAHLQNADKLTEPFNLGTPQGQVVHRLLDVLLTDGERMSQRAVKPLVESLLEAISDCLGDRGAAVSGRQRLADKRLSDIKNYILMNLSDPELCYDRVAANCGISPRYLCYVLKSHNTSFSELLWKNRLPRARDLLLSPAARDFPIHEIAFMCGFKSAAHFSRMFNAAYGCPPRQFRLTGGAAAKKDLLEDLVLATDAAIEPEGEELSREAA